MAGGGSGDEGEEDDQWGAARRQKRSRDDAIYGVFLAEAAVPRTPHPHTQTPS